MSFSFHCSSCGALHEGIPTFGATAPLSFYAIPEVERQRRCSLGTDDCVIDDEHFFVRGCIEVPVHGHADRFIWGVWVGLSKPNFAEWVSVFEKDQRSHFGPYFGWLNAWLKPYPDTMNLKTMVRLRDHGLRPLIEVEPTGHPLAIEQRDGIDESRVQYLFELMMHDATPPSAPDS